MKRHRYNKVLGLAIGERSLLVAEIADARQPEVNRLAEFVYPAQATPESLAQLGPALSQFLRDHGFTARVAVVGVPAGWLLVKSKDVPPADEATLADLLRLQAEGEFSSELKDLVYDYAGHAGTAGGSVLLMATPRRHLDAISAMCEAARLTVMAVTPSAAVLGAATGRSVSKNAMVLAVGASGGELTAQSGSHPSAIRRLRAPVPQPLFISELRRAVSMMPVNGSTRELVLWDGAGLDADALGKSLGIPVRRGELTALGVSTDAADGDGQPQQYAAAVALALSGIADRELPVDFLHSRLAPVKKSRIPSRAVLAGVAVLLLIVGYIIAWEKQQSELKDIATRQNNLTSRQGEIDTAQAFVNKVSLAQAWHGGDPRYLACLRDLTLAIPDDGQTYATTLVIAEQTKIAGSSAGTSQIAATKAAERRPLTGQLIGRMPSVEAALKIMDRMKGNRAFTVVQLDNTKVGHASDDTFTINFTYEPQHKKS